MVAKLRRYKKVITIIQAINEKEKLIGQICHAGWVLISAKILQGKTETSTPGIKDDVENDWATWLTNLLLCWTKKEFFST